MRVEDLAAAGAARRWDALLAAHPGAWFAHERAWLTQAGGETGALVLDGAGDALALVPYGPAGPAVVSGLNEPSGPLLRPGLRGDDRRTVWRQVDEVLRGSGAERAVLKFPVVDGSGPRLADPEDGRALRALGYQVVPRDFHVLDLRVEEERLWQGVSARVRTQIRRAERDCTVGPAGPAEFGQLMDAYRQHAAVKGTPPVLTVEGLTALHADPGPPELIALIGRHEGRPAGFALCLGRGRGASLVAWGSVPGAQRSQLSKLLAWRSLTTARDRGFGWIEYGGSVTDVPRLAGLTEFYRRLGGQVLTSVWAHRRLTG